ncbi:hypothetical protein LY76DRAFT_13093 [Colletotrichum caudatum]|nr:hypothetical protein LY76DRAFT_13093 [Colletotrichum caudatum]
MSRASQRLMAFPVIWSCLGMQLDLPPALYRGLFSVLWPLITGVRKTHCTLYNVDLDPRNTSILCLGLCTTYYISTVRVGPERSAWEIVGSLNS